MKKELKRVPVYHPCGKCEVTFDFCRCEKKEASELEYLKFFYSNADFGPGHGDVMFVINENFVEATGKKVPKNYLYE